MFEPTANAKKPLTMIDVAGQLYRHNPQRVTATFYRGITSNLIGSSIAWGAFFGIKSRALAYITSTKTNMVPSNAATESKAKPTKSDYFWAALVAGVGTQLITNPIFVVKTRMMATERDVPNAYPSTAAAFERIWRQEGQKAFFKGMGISMVGTVQGAIQFAVYDSMNDWFREHSRNDWFHELQQNVLGRSNQEGRRGKDDTTPWTVTIITSSLGKAVPVTLTYPYQVIRSRLQMTNAEARFGKGIRGVVSQLRKEAGFRGFYRGLPSAIGRTLPATWTTFLVYEKLKPYLTKRFAEDKSGDYPEP